MVTRFLYDAEQADKPTFELVHPDLQKNWPLCADTPEQQMKLMEEIQDLIERCSVFNSVASRNSLTVTIPDFRTTMKSSGNQSDVVRTNSFSTNNLSRFTLIVNTTILGLWKFLQTIFLSIL